MRLYFHILLVLASCAHTGTFAQHTPITSQYLFNGLLINPAYAGSRDALTANLTHRQQWVGFEGAPVTQVLSIHTPISDRKIGLGLLVFNDRIGVSRETGILTNYAYRIKLPHGKLSFGLGAGFNVARSNWQDVALQQGNDLSFQTNERSLLRPNFSTGVYYYGTRSFIGLSLPFLLKQRDTSAENVVTADPSVNMQPMLFAGHLITLSSQVKLKPTMLLRFTESGGLQGDLSAHVILHDKFWFGTSYRSNDAIVTMFEVLPTPQWRIGYAYDIGLSEMRRYNNGSHELMLQYEFGYRIKVRDPRYF